jgi:hypothetical protein
MVNMLRIIQVAFVSTLVKSCCLREPPVSRLTFWDTGDSISKSVAPVSRGWIPGIREVGEYNGKHCSVSAVLEIVNRCGSFREMIWLTPSPADTPLHSVLLVRNVPVLCASYEPFTNCGTQTSWGTHDTFERVYWIRRIWGSSVSVWLQTERPGFDPQQRQRIFLLILCSSQLWDPPSLLFNVYPGSYPRG